MKKGLDQIYAERQAETLMASWRERGFEGVEAWAVFKNGEWTVESNLVNGAPQGTRRLPLAEGWG